MTPKEFQTLVYIHQYIQTHGYSPTYTEIANARSNKSIGYITRVISNLHDGGIIDRQQAAKRNIILTDKGEKLAKISQ